MDTISEQLFRLVTAILADGGEITMMDLAQRQEATIPVENGTFSYLGTLPRVPLPELQDSLTRFEQWCAPLLTEEELEQTREAIAEFACPGGPGAILQTVLNAYDQQPDVHSWLDKFWPARYLGRRVPVSINANFIMAFRQQPLTQIQRAALLVGGGVRYKQLLDQELIPPATQRDKLLCMVQNKYLFSATRIPGEIHDIAKAPYSKTEPGPSQARHILVIHKHQLFRLDVIASDGRAHGLNELEAALQNILDAFPDRLPTQESVGYLTTLPRTDWARVRGELLAESVNNPAHMETIEQALFCLCLDEAEPDNLHHSADQLLHGDGGNRWFDKSISLIVFKNGVAGINCEHCGLDGTTVVDFVDFLHSDATQDALQASRKNSIGIPAFTPITFALRKSLHASIRSACNAFHALADNTATTCFSFDDFGATHIKSLKISPDAFAQLGFQLAHFNTKGLVGATYESVATRQYDRGRTEAMRVVTAQIVEFVNSMQDPQTDAGRKRRALRTAAEQHIKRLRQCQAGEAPEQHLWQLQLIAQERGMELGIGEHFRLFESPGWLKMRNDYLSTSSAPSDNITLFGFGATSEQCIGTAYLVRKDSIKAYLSTPSTVAQHMHVFADNLHVAFREMATLLQEEANE